MSPKKQQVLSDIIDQDSNTQTKRSHLKTLCKTRWVERHDAFEVFIELYPYVSYVNIVNFRIERRYHGYI